MILRVERRIGVSWYPMYINVLHIKRFESKRIGDMALATEVWIDDEPFVVKGAPEEFAERVKDVANGC